MSRPRQLGLLSLPAPGPRRLTPAETLRALLPQGWDVRGGPGQAGSEYLIGNADLSYCYTLQREGVSWQLLDGRGDLLGWQDEDGEIRRYHPSLESVAASMRRHAGEER